MDIIHILSLSLIIFIAAVLYSLVGHGGASAYLAAMAIFGLAPSIMKPTALILNVLVSGIGIISYQRAGAFSWPVFWPFVLGSMPLSFWGSTITISHSSYRVVLGLVLVFTSCWFLVKREQSKTTIRKGSIFLQIFLGGLIGFLSGLTGIGGGVFLSPILILTGWADTRKTSGTAAAFIFLNSITGIIGHISVAEAPPAFIWYFICFAMLGGIIGSSLGARCLSSSVIKKFLAVVLLIAGIQLLILPIFQL